MINSPFPQWAVAVCEKIKSSGYEACLVGGCVRDALLGRTAQDVDIATNATPEHIEALFEKTWRLGRFGTVCLQTEQGVAEITPYRVEGAYLDARHPDTVQRVDQLADDVKRRDFTINALAFDGEQVLDFVDGRKDLEKRVIRTVGDADKRFAEDALRILRAFRFAAQLDFIIEPQTYQAAITLADNLQRISKERIWEEVTKLLCAPYPSKGMEVFSMSVLQLPKRQYQLDHLPPNLILRVTALMQQAALDAKEAVDYLQRLTAPRRLIGQVKERLQCMSIEGPAEYRLAYYPWDVVRDTLLIEDPDAVAPIEEMMRRGRCLQIEQLAVRGDMLHQVGCQGPQIGAMLHRLLDHVREYPEDNTPQKLLSIAAKLQQQEGKGREELERH